MSFSKFVVNKSRDDLLTDFAKKTMRDRYLLPDESYQDTFARISIAYADDAQHASRMYEYISKLWFLPATPIISNGGTSDYTRWKLENNLSYNVNALKKERGLPISCFLNQADDNLKSISNLWQENIWLASKGGGIGSYYGEIRSVGEKISTGGVASGIMPYIKVVDSMTLAVSQSSLRRGATAVYIPVDHPEIEEFISLRKPTGGDYNRRALNIHHGVCITDSFMKAVENNEKWQLISPKTHQVIREISARDLMIRIISARIETGEPYLLFTDTVNRSIPEIQKILKLNVKTSNLCSEITLPTGIDHLGNERTAVCCLGSVNLTFFEDWVNKELFIEDCIRYLDNVLEDFIHSATDDISKARYSAMRERSIGLGIMGLHDFFQSKMLPFDSALARGWNSKIFKHIGEKSTKASQKLAKEKGVCPDAKDAIEIAKKQGFSEEYIQSISIRCSNVTAIAPTASISIIANTSPGIDPIVSNAYTHKTLSGSFIVKNKNLENLLIDKGINNEEIWNMIIRSEGSVQNLKHLSDHEKKVFRTAFEINQIALINQAADRQKYISQAQSLNIFFLSNANKLDLLMTHMLAWKSGIKSLYYLRSQSIQRVENADTAEAILRSHSQIDLPLQYEECESCQ
ncbi:ribonucleoside-diphosphate reductase subunit alpha [Candidatus Gromoviella agglomerans]|uniref:ribonucleoside-diphosphate reductase subunit alpha n=1 Tax=Candidatus Gromoviella agglomerans TaxID=2806609 RepID=UPI001E2F705C|nr:ribonucleoside-diphosphate reductase subunit alpha [Candidatus Gromoviella agglomerans]UFX98384.1 Ribonucleoside-diphosphate reductase subunit alpha [Candidatus Gromoviella agglomerans]